MKLTVKTLKGSKFEVECESSSTVLEVKGIIQSTNSDLSSTNLKLIHSGKVLKDDTSIESCGIKPNDFLVVMVTKTKKAAAAAKASTPAAAKAPATDKASNISGSDGTNKSTADEKTTETTTSSSASPSVASEPASNASNPAEFPVEVINSLTGMGFPEAEVRHCLRASGGNPDAAVEFLTNGIPPGMQPGELGTDVALASSSGGSDGEPLSALRSHPQFNALRQLVQSNPAMLQTVLTQIGQQQPELLTEINTNQEAFLRMMNEPIEETSGTSPGSSSNSESNSSPTSSGSDTGMQGIPPGMMEGMANPAQMAQLIQNMSPDELNQMATMMGLSPEQLRSTAQMLGQIPPEQLQQYMAQAMQGGGGGGIPGMMGDGGGGGGGPGGPQVLRLTQEEMAAVDRLADMGFDRTEAAQAYLACDKNESLAANLLMDSMGDSGFGFGASGADGGGGGSGGGNNSGGNDGDDMYD